MVQIKEQDYTYPKVYQGTTIVAVGTGKLEANCVLATFLRIPSKGVYYAIKHVARYSYRYDALEEPTHVALERCLGNAYRELLRNLEVSRHKMVIDGSITDHEGNLIMPKSEDQTPENERIEKLLC